MCVYTHKGDNQERSQSGEREFQMDEATQAEGQPQLHGHEDGTGKNA